MSGNFSDAFENTILNHIFRKAFYPYIPIPISVGLCTADPTDEGTGASCNELPDEAGYARVLTSAPYWSFADEDSTIVNIKNISFPIATVEWAEVTHFALFESDVYGEGGMLMYGELDEPETIEIATAFSFRPGAIHVKLSGT